MLIKLKGASTGISYSQLSLTANNVINMLQEHITVCAVDRSITGPHTVESNGDQMGYSNSPSLSMRLGEGSTVTGFSLWNSFPIKQYSFSKVIFKGALSVQVSLFHMFFSTLFFKSALRTTGHGLWSLNVLISV